MKIIGLTGGIGSGKTSVLQLFIDKDVPVYIADIEAKKLMQSNREIKQKIQAAFGDKAYRGSVLNKSYLANIVFKNSDKLQVLNSIVHPVVHRHFKKFIAEQNTDFIIYEYAILFENGSDSWCDYIIVVTAPIETRIQRVIKRDKVTIDQVIDRMANQWDEQHKIKKADFVIVNTDWETTKRKVEELYKQLLKLSKTQI